MAAEDKANVSYIEQLREMRATRIQQLRQGNEQKQQFSLMTRTLNSVVAATNTQTRVATQNLREQQAVVRQTREMSRDIRSLSSSIARSIGSLTSAIGRGVGGAASLAGRGVAVTAGATVNLTSSIMSVLGRVLPIALVGVLGKAFIWDNLTSDTKNKLTNAIGGMFLRIFDTLKPFFSKIGETIRSLFQDISVEMSATFAGIGAVMNRAMEDMVGSIEKSISPLKDSLEDIGDFVGAGKRAIEKVTPNVNLGGLNVGDVITAGGTVLAGKGAYDLVKGGQLPRGVSGPVIVITDDIKKTYELIAKNGLSDKPGNLVGARIIVEAQKNSSSKAANFLRFVFDHKIANVIGVIVPAAMYLWDVSMIEQILSKMEQENLITMQEKEYFLSTGKTMAAASLTSSALLSTLAMYATRGMGGGKAATIGGGALGSLAGTKMGEFIGKPLHEAAEFLGLAPKRPESLDRQTVTGTTTVEQLRDLRKQRRGEKIQGSEVVPNMGRDAVDINDPDIQKILNRGEREGVRQNPYQSAEGGTPTIGIGHKLTPEEMKAGGVFIDGKLVPLDLKNVKDPSVSEQGPKQLTKEQVMKLYEQDHKKHFNNARNFIGADVFDKLTKDQQLALADMSFMNPASLTPELKKMVVSGNVQGVAKYMENWGQFYTKDGKQVYSPHLQSSARGRAKLYAGPGGYSAGMMDNIATGMSNYASVYMQAFSAAREAGYKDLEKRRGEDGKEEKTKMKFFSQGTVAGLLDAFKDGSELKSNIVSDLRNMTSVLSVPSEDKKEPVKNIVTNFNTTNVNNVSGGGGGGGTASVSNVRPNNDLVTDFLKMSGT